MSSTPATDATNGHTPPLFPETRFFVGLGVFVIAILLRAESFILHYRRQR